MNVCTDVYPRPQLRRDSFLSLDGPWEFVVSPDGAVPQAYDRQIRVPYCPESRLSGIGKHFPEGNFLYYRRDLPIGKPAAGTRVLLHIGAADQELTCYVNTLEIGSHVGGYTAFTFDITDALREENTLVLRVRDDLRDNAMPYGKQSLTPGGMWYTPVSGIWQSVWLEKVPERYIRTLRIQADADRAVLDTGDESLSGQVAVTTPEGTVTLPLAEGCAEFRPSSPRRWSPEDPYLYECVIQTGEDRVESYFALRSLETKTVGGIPRLCLNGKPYFFHGLLDQGYWPDGLYTPASPDCYREDILTAKAMGYNMLRKHVKVEPEIYYYLCDKLGMVVFQDMVNNGDYHYIHDTVLPTLGIQRRKDKNAHRNPRSREMFLKNMKEIVSQLGNHPCIALWTIFNEGWGQFHASAAYDTLKALDGSRFICSASGWFRGGKSDVFSRHIYFGQWHHLRLAEKPLVLSEFGGICLGVKGHRFDPKKSYGYQNSGSLTEYREKLVSLYREHILPAIPRGLCAAVYTQLTDVEEEINGLMTYDRQVEKADRDAMAALAKELQNAIR